jgi:hypothetical protein
MKAEHMITIAAAGTTAKILLVFIDSLLCKPVVEL